MASDNAKCVQFIFKERDSGDAEKLDFASNRKFEGRLNASQTLSMRGVGMIKNKSTPFAG
ncbi:conserved protein of unknown function [Ectopseudomonas oleovorans]|uniref:Uncharacterized protein n=1 Tax=Ectopseudomonas oleovorans TaxID=301 RepID=A0A653B5M3_ECTOL|nr:conserved protein of unknown function [Pseudomonas oleovorans]